jgi:rhodanese-related sulfurtransferase
MGFRASALEGGFDAWKAEYPVEPVETEQAVR